MDIKRVNQYMKYLRIVSLSSLFELSYFLARYKNGDATPSKGSMEIRLNGGLKVLINRAKRDEAETFLEMFIGEPYLHHLPKGINEKKGAVVVDIGANIGLFSLYACTKLANPRIYAYEPDETNFRELKQNIEANGLSNSIKPFRLAIGKSGKVRFFSAIRGAHSLVENVHKLTPGTEKGRSTYVDSIRITKILSDLGHIDLLKMDCEGSEWAILEDIKAIPLNIDYLCIEYHEVGGKKVGEMAKIFTKKGYTVHLRDVDKGRTSGILTAVKKAAA